MAENVFKLSDLKDKAPKLVGIPTGTKLDEMFYKLEYQEKSKRFVKQTLGGIPYTAVLNITGSPDTGKSVFVEQFAVVQASQGYGVLFVTTESPAEFLYPALKQKALALKQDFSRVEENIVIIDASQNDKLRENMQELLDTMANVIKYKKVKNVVIDSVTGLYEHKEVMARKTVRQIYNFLKKFRQTALLVSQKRSANNGGAEAAGGLAVPHILDGTIVFEKKVIESRWDENLYKMPIGSVLRLVRIDGCRLAPHAGDTYVFEITDAGLIDIKKPLKDFIK